MSLKKIADAKPLVHCITNYVAANFTANVLLTIGASPIMADAVEEVEEMAQHADAVLINIGTLNPQTLEAMLVAGKGANKYQTPIVLDPVGVGATKFRQQTVLTLLKTIQFQVIRCNESELAALTNTPWESRGVDGGQGEVSLEQVAKEAALQYNCFVIVTGREDLLTDGRKLLKITGGHEKITKITASGCVLSAICAALIGSTEATLEDFAAVLQQYKEIAMSAYAEMGTFHENFFNELEKKTEEIR